MSWQSDSELEPDLGGEIELLSFGSLIILRGGDAALRGVLGLRFEPPCQGGKEEK